ncbi:hypothetical protein H5410_061545, partial [Solanum commersonii]
YCGLFIVAYAEFLSAGLQVPSYGIISQTLRMRYASLLWNYGILKAQSGYDHTPVEWFGRFFLGIVHLVNILICQKKNNARFQMTMVYELLKRRFIFENNEKKDGVFINYCGMPLFFGKREFSIITGLKCHSPYEK